MDHDRYIGRLLDNRYEIQEVIGVGGMAVVYKARCHRLNRLVAIKILKDEHARDEEFQRRFNAESQAVAMLSHPNIVSVYDVSSSNDAHYIVMELIDGITLKQYMEKKGILNWKETLHFAIQIAKALEHAHSRGIVHRDIKPHNVMVLKNGSVKVADFGIARVMSKSNTLTKEALGSVHYISPEQAKGGRVDSRSDLYSLGVVMYEMITGRPPFDGESPVAVAIQHINGGAKMPSTLNPNIPGGLEQIIMKAMAHDPANRYVNATAMLYDMDEFRKEPSMLFDYNTPPIDEVTRLGATAAVVEQPQQPAPKTTAERVVAAKNEPPVRNLRTVTPGRTAATRKEDRGSGTATRNPSRRRRESAEQREARRSRVTTIATIAIITCSIVAMIALGIFLWTGLNGGFFGPPETKLYPVPSLVGENYDALNKNGYEGLQIVLQSREYSETPAGLIISQEPVADEQVVAGTKVMVVVSLGPEPKDKIMDQDLTGLSLTDAKNYLISQGVPENLILTREEYSATIAEGKVTKTDPVHGEKIEDGAAVTLWVSLGKEVVTARMPNVVGDVYDIALIKLNDAGFMDVTEEPVDSNEPLGTVLSQSVDKYTNADVTTAIVLQTSKGPAQKAMLNVVGKSYTEAYQQLTELGFLDVYPKEVTSNEPAGTVLEQSVAAATLTDITAPIELQVSKGPKVVKMPSLEGKTFQEASQILTSLGFTTVTRNDVENDLVEGTILSQSVEQGNSVTVITEIVLEVSAGPKKAVMPNLDRKTYEEAYQILLDLGFITVTREDVESNQPAGLVVGQSVANDLEVPVKTEILLQVSKGPNLVPVADVVGKTYEEAYQTLSGLGFTVTRMDVESDAPVGQVVNQSIAQDTQVLPETEIVLQVSKGPAAPATVKKIIQVDLSAYVGEPVQPFLFELIQEGEAPAYRMDNCAEPVVSVTLEGQGVQYYNVYVNEEYKQTLRVDFDAE